MDYRKKICNVFLSGDCTDLDIFKGEPSLKVSFSCYVKQSGRKYQSKFQNSYSFLIYQPIWIDYYLPKLQEKEPFKLSCSLVCINLRGLTSTNRFIDSKLCRMLSKRRKSVCSKIMVERRFPDLSAWQQQQSIATQQWDQTFFRFAFEFLSLGYFKSFLSTVDWDYDSTDTIPTINTSFNQKSSPIESNALVETLKEV